MGSNKGMEEGNLKQEPGWQVFEILLSVLKYWVSCLGFSPWAWRIGKATWPPKITVTWCLRGPEPQD